jgi:hypothetical protein
MAMRRLLKSVIQHLLLFDQLDQKQESVVNQGGNNEEEKDDRE